MSSLSFSIATVVICTLLAVIQSQKVSQVDPARQDTDVSDTDLCRLCSRFYGCPPECFDLYNVKTKRLGGIDGLTFDDYIFMRLLGRDTANRKLY